MKRFDRSLKNRPKGAGPPPPPEGAPVELDIVEMGVRGDAVAQGPIGPIYVPYALPGERVRALAAGDRAQLQDVLVASPDRVAPPCRHFGACGGCQLQHWKNEATLAWKAEQLARALARRELDVAIDPIRAAWGAGRRRAALHAVRAGRDVRVGFIARGGARVIGIAECPVLTPMLADALPKLAELARAFAPQRGELTMPALATETGLDVDLKGAGRAGALSREQLELAARLADQLDLARLSFDGEPVAARRQPQVRMGDVLVTPPPGAFLQATQEGEEILAALALEGLQAADRVCDLFAGVGTFGLRAARHAEVHAVEGEMASLDAAKKAADSAGGRLKRFTVERRDLLRAPIAALELKRFDGVVFDPPRSGARLQAEQIGRSKVSRVVAVSCDVVTFARDVRVLVDAGFKLERVTPVDQFRFSPHLEMVGVLSR
jgi:23S rRNA (uracil1939-C5)-methyltransferase